MRRMTKLEARRFSARWAAAGAAEIAELRATSKTRKMRQLIALMSSADKLAWSAPLAAEESDVRERWRRLRNSARG